jgi:Zn finger protein HypA/HybF involved in hydrogenase expression
VIIGLLTFKQGIIYCTYKKEVDQMQAYCVKCRAKREMKDAKSITMKNGKPATQGICPTCGTKMFRIGKA